MFVAWNLIHKTVLAPGNMMRFLELWKISVSLVTRNLCIREVGCRCCLEIHSSVHRYQTLYLNSKLYLVYIRYDIWDCFMLCVLYDSIEAGAEQLEWCG